MRKIYITYNKTSINADKYDVVLEVSKEMDLIQCFRIACRMRPDEIIINMKEEHKC